MTLGQKKHPNRVESCSSANIVEESTSHSDNRRSNAIVEETSQRDDSRSSCSVVEEATSQS